MSPRKPVNASGHGPDPIVTPPPSASKPQDANLALPAEHKNSAGFPIVALGAAAGGLEALKKFFAKLPPDSGVGLVLIQHLSPSKRCLLPSALGKLTPLAVRQAKDGMRIEPNHVYVNPPGKPLALFSGAFQAIENPAIQGIRQPIDFFFKSLAEDQRESAIGVILSGTGSDGALGLTAINKEGGLTIVQEPADAVYEGMPRRALATGLIDFVLPAGQIPERLMKCAANPGLRDESTLEQDGSVFFDFLQKILLFIRRQTGQDFSQYKQSTILRRIKRRMGIHQLVDPEQYLDYLQRFPQEATILFHELLIGVTSFFRDEETFAALKAGVILYLVKHRQGEESLRLWVVGCSTGEEAYSLAMLIAEYQRESGQNFPVQIFASDIDREAIAKARRCRYPRSIAESIGAERLKLFFRKEGDGYRLSKRIRGMVVFAVQNVIKDPPFSKIDLISCRNLLIYLEPELQKKVLLLFHYALSPDGLLLLGSAESVGELTNLLQPWDKKQKIFRRGEGPSPCWPLVNFPTGTGPLSWSGSPSPKN